jgi:hypothetical protein
LSPGFFSRLFKKYHKAILALCELSGDKHKTGKEEKRRGDKKNTASFISVGPATHNSMEGN